MRHGDTYIIPHVFIRAMISPCRLYSELLMALQS